MKNPYKDEDLLRLLRGKITEQDKALDYILKKMKGDITNYLRFSGCKSQDASAYFYEALTALTLRTQNKDFKITSSLKGYLKMSSRNIWLSADKSEKALKAREELVGNASTKSELGAEIKLFHSDRAKFVKDVLSNLGEGCAEVMLLKASGYSSAEITDKTKYSSSSSVDKKNSVCLRKLKELMKENPKIREQLKDLLYY